MAEIRAGMNAFQFARIPRIHFGTGSFSNLANIIEPYGSQVVIICSRSVSAFPVFSGFLDQLNRKQQVAEVCILTGEPSPQFVDQVVDRVSGRDPSCVVAIGGGSVVDAGKAVSAMIPLGGRVKEYLEGVGSREPDGRKIPFIAVPTTAGTGSEATRNAVISEPGPSGFKKSLRHVNYVPDIAVIDPALTLTCPLDVTMSVGMDAFTQLLEAYTSTGASPLTDALAWNGLEMSVRSLPVVFTDPDNLEARSELSYAALLSGITLANAGLGVVHGFASVIGGLFPAPHGVVCGALVAPVTRENIRKLMATGEHPNALWKYSRVGGLFTPEPSSMEKQLEMLSERIEAWANDFRIPKLGKFGITRANADHIVSQAGQKTNPVKLDPDELAGILLETME